MNNIHTLHIPEKTSRTRTIKIIKQALDENPGVVLVDLVDVSFPLHRDFFLVLSKKFPKDKYIIRVNDEKIGIIARSLGIQVEVVGLQAEFERTYSANNMATHNMSMFEYFVYELKRGWLWLKFMIFDRRKREKKINYFKKSNSNVFLIIAGLISSLTLLLFIFHFAISKTIITITPQINVRPITANIVYRTEQSTGSILSTKNTLQLKKMEIPIETTMKFQVDTVDPNSALNSRGVITIYNELNVAQDLRPATRFVTVDGLVFRTTDWIKIPASKSLNGVTEMGILEVNVVADMQDVNGKLVGSRGNIPAGTDLTIPGLKFNRDRVYAKAKDNFTGGEEPRVHIVTEEEIKNFEKVLYEQAQKLGRMQLQEKLNENFKKTGEDFALFLADAVKFSDPSFIIISGQKYGDTADEVEIQVKTNLTATVFDKKATIEYLTQIFRENLLRGTNKELGTHPDTLRISNVVSRSEDDSEIKATLEMNTSTTYDFENATNELTRRLKILIAGLSNKEAKDRLINEGQVREVSIQNYPFWTSSVSGNVDNIEFYIKK